jgi:hypothetical protein
LLDDFVRRVVDAFGTEGLEGIVVFGSRARGAGHIDSDLDVAVLMHSTNRAGASAIGHRLGELAADAQIQFVKPGLMPKAQLRCLATWNPTASGRTARASTPSTPPASSVRSRACRHWLPMHWLTCTRRTRACRRPSTVDPLGWAVSSSSPRTPVVGRRREAAADAAAGVGLVVPVARDQGQVQVHDGLAGGRAVVDTDVAAGRRMLCAQFLRSTRDVCWTPWCSLYAMQSEAQVPWREVSAMITREQYVVDEAGQRTAVLVPLDDWERIQEALEELADLRAYDEVKRHPSEPVPFEKAMAEIDADTGI